MQISKKIENFFIYGLGQSINLLSPLIVTPYLVSVCKEEGLGKIGISFSICLILNCLVDYSSYLNGTKSIVIHKNNRKKLAKIIASIYTYKFILLTSICLLFSSIIIILPTIQEKSLYLMSLSVVVSQFLNPNWILQGLENFKLISILNVCSKLFYILMIFGVVKNYGDYIWANFFWGLGGVIVYAIAVYFILKKHYVSFNKSSIIRGLSILKKDFNICLSEFCLSIYQFFPIVIIGAILGNASAGIYRVIEQIFSIFRTFIFMYFNFSFANVCYEIEQHLQHGLKVWKQYHLVQFCCIGIGCFVIYTLANPVLNYFNVAPQDFKNLIHLLRFSLMVPLILVISQAFRQLMFALNLTQAYTRIIYVSSIINLILLIIFTQIFELYGAFISIMVIEAFVIFLYTNTIRKHLKSIRYEDSVK